MAGGETSKRLTGAAVAGALAAGYLLSAVFSLEVGEAAGLWTSAGFLTGILVLLRGAYRTGATAASLVGHLAAACWLGSGVATATLFPLINLFEAGLTAYLALTFCGARARRISLRALVLIALGAIVPAGVVGGALGGGLLALREHRAFLGAWLDWTVPTVLGSAIVTPALLLVARSSQYRDFARSGVETVGLLTGLAGLTMAMVWQTELPLYFVVFPAMTLVAFRLGPAGAAVAGFLVAVIVLPMTALGHGPAMLAPALDRAGRVRLSQVFVAAALFTGMATAGVLADQTRLRRLMVWRDRAARAARTRARAAERLAAAPRPLTSVIERKRRPVRSA